MLWVVREYAINCVIQPHPPFQIVELGEYALKHFTSNLGSEKWTVYEQVGEHLAILDYNERKIILRGNVFQYWIPWKYMNCKLRVRCV